MAYHLFITFLVSMVPVMELRGAIPIGAAFDLPAWAVLLTSVIGNMLPVPLIILFVRRVFEWLEKKWPKLGRMIQRLEARARTKGEIVYKYELLGLLVLVAIPLPGTGAWTGSLVAALMDIRLKSAIPVILAGVIIAGTITTCICYGVIFQG